jgi:hypothetical protein
MVMDVIGMSGMICQAVHCTVIMVETWELPMIIAATAKTDR